MIASQDSFSTSQNQMIKSIRLKNFKSYKDSGVIEFAPLTILIGCNNAGKSSILQALLLLSQTVKDSSYRSRLVTRGQHVDLGGYYDIVHGSNRNSRKRISIELTKSPLHSSDNSTGLSLSFGYDRKKNSIFIGSVELKSETETLFTYSEKTKEFSAKGIPSKQKKYLRVNLKNFLPTVNLVPDLVSKLLKTSKTLTDVVESGFNYEHQSNIWASLIHNITRVPPHRSHVPFYGGLGERASNDETGPAVLRSLADTRTLPLQNKDKTLVEAIDYWMGKLNILGNVQLNNLDDDGWVKSLIADDISGQSGVNVAAMGEGVSQLLPIIAAVLRSSGESPLLIEQPEIHLHPNLQADLADLFVDLVDRKKRQIIVETHSEHLLLRLRTHIANGLISPDDVSILFVEKQNGVSTTRRLDLKYDGHFDDWPKGFLDQTYRESLSFALASARAKGKK